MKLTIEHLAGYLPYGLKVQYEGIVNGKELSDWDKKLKGYKSANTDNEFDLFFDDISGFTEEYGEKPNEIIGVKIGLIRQVHICKNHTKVLIGGRGMKVYYSNNFDFKPILYRVEDMSNEQIIQWGKLVRTHFPEEFDKDGMTDESILKNAPEALSLIKELGFNAFEEITFKQSLLLSKFFYLNHIDIHNLIDSGLAIDAKTLNP